MSTQQIFGIIVMVGLLVNSFGAKFYHAISAKAA